MIKSWNQLYPLETGFTLIELMIAMMIASIIMGFLYSVHERLTISTANQKMMIKMQQNLRGGLTVMEKEIRMAGYNPKGVPDFKIIKAGFKDDLDGTWINVNSVLPAAYSSSLVFSSDRDGNGHVGSNEIISYSICDLLVSKPDGVPDLARNSGGGRQKVAIGIEKMGLAYAFDADLDGIVDFHDIDSDGVMDREDCIIWAVDTDGDNLLDLNIDINRDGVISRKDDSDGNGIINHHDGPSGFTSGVGLGKIRAVKIWLMARSGRIVRSHVSGREYVVGNMIVDAKKDQYARQVLLSTIWCRNLE